MKKHTFLGVSGIKCCILECLVSFDNLIPSEIEASDFNHNSTDWCGCDTITRTEEIEQLKETGRKIVLENPIIFYGSDYDCGHRYPWDFKVEEIWELEE